MDKIIVFVDCASLEAAAERAGCGIDTAALVDYLADPNEGRMLVEAFAYLAIDPRHEREGDIALDELWSAGLLVRHKVGTIVGDTYACDLAVEIALDMARAAYEMSPDVVVVATADDRLIPAVMTLRGKGIRVEVASFASQASRMLRQRCSGFIDLEALASAGEAAACDEGPSSQGGVRAKAEAEVEAEATVADASADEGVWVDVSCEGRHAL